jgi:DNA-binding NarL/FixJ family response regulator
MPRMMRDVFKQMLEQPDIEIVGELDDPLGLLLAAGRTHADVVILGLNDAEFPGVSTHLLSEYPHIKILGVTEDGRRAYLYELRPQKVAVGEVSPQGLLKAIRSAVHAQGV